MSDTTHPEEFMESFYCSSFEQEEIYYSDIPELLDDDLLEENPKLYKFLLEQYALYRSPKDVVNSSYTDNPDPMYIAMTELSGSAEEDDSFDVTPQLCLAILAGDKSDYAKMRAKENPERYEVYYGAYSDNLDDELACDILEWMVKYGADPRKPNSIGLTPLRALQNPDSHIYGRVNNEKFKKMLMSYEN